jgi:WD40 repeat protein
VRGVTTLVSAQGRRLDLGASVVGVHWIGEEALFAIGDGRVGAADRENALRFIDAHSGAILCSLVHPDGERVVTGGDDGKLMSVSPEGEVEELADFAGKWVHVLAANAESGLTAAGVGKEAVIIQHDAAAHRFAHPSSVTGLAFDTKGRRLAVSHYGGATLRYALAADDKGNALNWKGSHLGVTFSPDGEYVITAMQEKELHAWRLPQKTDMRMSGYQAKTKSLSWDRRGRWLATSGADCAVVWPFVGKLGPQGKNPMTLQTRQALVTRVAFHPSEEILAIGYDDGAVFAVRLTDQVAIHVEDVSEGPVTALAWSEDGNQIAIGNDAGHGAIAALLA